MFFSLFILLLNSYRTVYRGYFIYYLFLNPSERRRWLIYINIVCERGMRRKRKYRLIGLIYRLLFTCWSWWSDFLLLLYLCFSATGQRHSSQAAVVVTRRCHRILLSPNLSKGTYSRSTCRLYVLLLSLYGCAVVIPSPIISRFYIVAHARAVIYEKIGAITISIYILHEYGESYITPTAVISDIIYIVGYQY